MFRAVLLLLCLILAFGIDSVSCEEGIGAAYEILLDDSEPCDSSEDDVREIERSGLYYDYYERGTHASGDGFFARLLNGLKNIADCLSSFIGSVRSRIGDHIESV